MSKRIRNRVNGGMIVWDKFDQVIYLAKGGNDANDGRNIETPVLTIVQALVLTAAETPSAVNRWAIVCLDDGIYTEALLELQDYVDIYMPNARFVGEIEAFGVGSYSSIKFREHYVPVVGVEAVKGFNITGAVVDLYIDVDRAEGISIYSDWVNISSATAATRIYVKWKSLTVNSESNSYGIYLSGDPAATVIVDGGEIIVNGAGVGIYIPEGICVGSVDVIRGGTGVTSLNKAVRTFDENSHAILQIGQIDGTHTALDVGSGLCTARVGEIINCDHDFTVSAGALELSVLKWGDGTRTPPLAVQDGTFKQLVPVGIENTDIAARTMRPMYNYITDRAGGVTFTLPATAWEGDTIKIVGTTGLWTVAQNADQYIGLGNVTTTVGVGGSLIATNVGDCIELMCTDSYSNGLASGWRVISVVGNITVN